MCIFCTILYFINSIVNARGAINFHPYKINVYLVYDVIFNVFPFLFYDLFFITVLTITV